jgi:predicted signal transduction protein with EAL and GGDEF domain
VISRRAGNRVDLPSYQKGRQQDLVGILLRIARDASARPDDIVQVTRDVTARKKLETQLRELSRTEGLTGSPNRRAFDDVLSMEWRRAMRESGACLSLAPIESLQEVQR